MEISSSQIKSVAQFRHVLEDDNLKKLILKYDARNAKNINFIINEINIFINNKFNENDKKFVFIVSIERNFNKDNKDEKDEQEKLRTVSIINENIKQVFIDKWEKSIFIWFRKCRYKSTNW